VRITYRHKDNKVYWTKRWNDIVADFAMTNSAVYPLKYALETVGQDKTKKILEAGCGAGRILRYFSEKEYDIVGMDFTESAIFKLKKTDPTLKVEVGDITDLEYADECFSYILAFGLYHNLELESLKKAVLETNRVLLPGGKVCASFRADNIQTLLTDWLTGHRSRNIGIDIKPDKFHKLNLKKNEFRRLFEENGFVVEKMYPVENMPILYKFKFFRSKNHKIFNENIARKEGYLLSRFGNILQGVLMKIFPDEFCNIFVLIAQKNEQA